MDQENFSQKNSSVLPKMFLALQLSSHWFLWDVITALCQMQDLKMSLLGNGLVGVWQCWVNGWP